MTANSARNNTLATMLVVALIIHAILILSIHFIYPKVDKASRSIAITLVTHEAKKAPKKAEFLAQNNQLGASKNQAPPAPAALKIASSGRQKSHPSEKSTVKQQKRKQKKILSKKKTNTPVQLNKKIKQENEKETPKLSMESLHHQIAELGATIRYQKPSSHQNRIKFINSVSAHKYLASQYINDWQRKIESMGNLNYPNIAKRAGFTQSLVMDVGIKPNGQIYSLRIRKSSGYPALDNAAKRIVHLSAPFPDLPKALLQELDILVITRVWKFTDKTR